MSQDNSDKSTANAAANGESDPVPFAAPVLSYAIPDQYRAEVRRDGSYVVVPHGLDLPNLCVHCGNPASVRMPFRFTLVAPPRRVGVSIGLCRFHYRRHKATRWACIAAFAIVGIAAYSVLLLQWLIASPHSPWADPIALIWLGSFTLAASAAIRLIKTSPLSVHKSNSKAIWLGPASTEFLAHLSPVEPSYKPFFNRDIKDLL